MFDPRNHLISSNDEIKELQKEISALKYKQELLEVTHKYFENVFEKLGEYLKIKPITTWVYDGPLSINKKVITGFDKIKSCEKCGHELKG
jgi:vacuolar-type H+-ATPase subunit E/Vma4